MSYKSILATLEDLMFLGRILLVRQVTVPFLLFCQGFQSKGQLGNGNAWLVQMCSN